MSILITGGCGFIGSNLIKQFLIEKDDLIINIDKLTYSGNILNVGECLKNKKYKFINGDICDKSLLLEVLYKYKPKAIINCAAETHVDRSISKRDPFIMTNILGTFNLLECSLEYFQNFINSDAEKFRYMQISTDEVFGSLDIEDNSVSENSPYRPNSPYSASKASADHLVFSYFKTFNLPTIIINSSNNYGPYQYPEKLIPLCINNVFNYKKFSIYGNGLNIRDWLYVKDHCRAISLILDNGRIGDKYNVGGGSELTNNQVVSKICKILDEIKPLFSNGKEISYKSFITYSEDRLGHDLRYSLNSSKIKEDLGWTPTVNFDEGILKTIKWYLENKKWLNEIIK